jgi:hypothetical protein
MADMNRRLMLQSGVALMLAAMVHSIEALAQSVITHRSIRRSRRKTPSLSPTARRQPGFI